MKGRRRRGWAPRRLSASPGHAAWEAVARDFADLLALVEAILEHFIRLELDGERLVNFPPEELVALDTGGVAGFRKAVRHM